MEHNTDFETWWNLNKNWYEKQGVSKDQFASFPFKNGINQGDIMVLANGGELELGDVIVFNSQSTNPIIHRIVNIKNLQTKGDNNQIPDSNTGDVIGKAVFKIPYFGWVKIFFNGIIGQKIIKC